MSCRRNDNTPGDAHELTFSCYRNLELLGNQRTCNWLLEGLDAARVALDFEVWAYVLMPDHVHVIVWPRRPNSNIADIRHAIKSPVARQAIGYLRENHSDWLPRLARKRGGRQEHLFWQSGGGYDRNIRCAKTLMAMIDYIHLNPVRKGLVVKARDWRWSSAGSFEGQESPAFLPDPIAPSWLDGLG